MLTNNNQKGPSAAARLAKLPVVQSACSQLLLLYTDTKCNHPTLKSVCEALENKATALGFVACDRVAPVMDKLQPQLSVANDVACKGLDWLETTFPVLHAPTEQVVATAKNKMHEIQVAVGIAAIGTLGCVQHTVTWVTEGMQQVDDETNQSLVKRAISVANVGLDTVLALLEEVLPSTEGETTQVVGDEPVGSYSARLLSLGVRLCQRSSHVVWVKLRSVQDVIEVHLQGGPTYRRRMSAFDNGCTVKGYVRN